MRKLEGFCKIHVSRGEGPVFRTKLPKIFFFHKRGCISYQISLFSAFDLLLSR